MIVRKTCFGAVLLALLSAAGAAPLNPDLQSLLQNSPFGPRSDAPVAARAAGPTKVEFRGYVKEKGEYWFSLFDVSGSRGEWVALDHPVDIFTVRGFDENSETVTVDFQGQTLKLRLKENQIQGEPAQNIAMSQPQPPPLPTTNGESSEASAASDARRLEQVAAEVRRRRALRQVNPPAPTP